MHLGAAIRRAVLLGLLCVAAPALRADAPPAPGRSFHLVQRLDDARVIQWRAVTREPGHFTIWRVDQRVERVGQVEARPGSQAYRFVDPAGARGGYVVYRLTYEGQSGSVQVLAVGTVAEPGLRSAALPSGGVTSPELLPASVTLLVPPDAVAELAPLASLAGRAPQAPPDPPPPRG